MKLATSTVVSLLMRKLHSVVISGNCSFVLQPSNGQATDGHAVPAAADGGTTQAGILVDVAGESLTDIPVSRPTAQPAADVDTATAIPEDNFTKYDFLLLYTVAV